MQATPVHFRVVKHGLQKGEVLGVILTGPPAVGGDMEIILPTFTAMTGKGQALQTWVRHHTDPATPEEYDDLLQVMKDRYGPVTPYEKLTGRFRL